ncbi:hypothetical protein FACS1894187_04210 [Synergistales bacterium]|nr:hypothetical protein FACS1894187_04210 [Synergistales bacterium]
MEKHKIISLKSQFDAITQTIDENDVEFWYARDLMPLLGYQRWENFDVAIERAITSCETIGKAYSDHFREVTKMVVIV